MASQEEIKQAQDEYKAQNEIVQQLKKEKAEETSIAEAEKQLAALKLNLCEKDPAFAEKERIKEEKRKAKEAKFLAKQKKAKPENSAEAAKKKVEKLEKKKKAMESEEKFVNTTPKGEKKDVSGTMHTAFKPQEVEAAWYDWWEKMGFFQPKDTDEGEKFVIVIPPPNVTGQLHLGHALTNSIQDTLVRWHRMKGHNTLWIPGIDHAGIATQVVVSKKLLKERNVTPHDLGREAFIKEVWNWKKDYGGRICNQLRRLGSSLDWTREVFTMDDKLSRAVKEGFIRMYNDKLIYRDHRLVNWCCKLKTAISDIEVDHIELTKATMLPVPNHDGKKYEFGVLVSFAYPMADGEGEVVVATTRIETMLADTAVAVHPDDARYTALHGQFLIHPLNGRKIPVICDAELVDMEFGTGAVKITPAHDPNDFATGKRHNLEFINLFTEEGLVNANGGAEFEGMRRFDARNAVIDALDKKGLLRGKCDNPMKVPVCSRTGDIIEPMVKPQWFVNCKSMAERSVAAVRSGELRLIPAQHEATWFHYLENIREWCISRQLWWGHRIPAYWACPTAAAVELDGANGQWIVATTESEARTRAAAALGLAEDQITLTQDPDVLDTWFSSGLFPFSVFGWPDESVDLSRFFPGSLLETGHDILFFWVARMVMMSLHLTDKLPFTDVYLHAMVRDAHGKKMSKSLGNVIDPVDVMNGITLEGLHGRLKEGNLPEAEVQRAMKVQKQDYPHGIIECGTDALRFALVAYTSQGRDVNLDINRVVSYRQFCNKLWNATRFAMQYLGSDFHPDETFLLTGKESLADKWILSRAVNAVAKANQGFLAYDFAGVTTAIYSFWLYELCDVYLECLKTVFDSRLEVTPEIAAARATAVQVLYTVLDIGLRLIHPITPFITEELFQRLPRRASEKDVPSIMVAAYPEGQACSAWADDAAERAMALVNSAVHALRSMRQESQLDNKKLPQLLMCVEEEFLPLLTSDARGYVASLGRSGSVQLTTPDKIPAGCFVALLEGGRVQLHWPLKGLIDAKLQLQKLEKKITTLEKNISENEKALNHPDFPKKPENIQTATKEKAESLAQQKTMLLKTKAMLESIL